MIGFAELLRSNPHRYVHTRQPMTPEQFLYSLKREARLIRSRSSMEWLLPVRSGYRITNEGYKWVNA